jgi:hypothetical protein
MTLMIRVAVLESDVAAEGGQNAAVVCIDVYDTFEHEYVRISLCLIRICSYAWLSSAKTPRIRMEIVMDKI